MTRKFFVLLGFALLLTSPAALLAGEPGATDPPLDLELAGTSAEALMTSVEPERSDAAAGDQEELISTVGQDFCVPGASCTSDADCGFRQGYCSTVSYCCVCF